MYLIKVSRDKGDKGQLVLDIIREGKQDHVRIRGMEINSKKIGIVNNLQRNLKK